MTKERPADQTPWMSAPDYGRSLRPGVGFNLLVRDVEKSVRFAEEVLGALVGGQGIVEREVAFFHALHQRFELVERLLELRHRVGGVRVGIFGRFLHGGESVRQGVGGGQ